MTAVLLCPRVAERLGVGGATAPGRRPSEVMKIPVAREGWVFILPPFGVALVSFLGARALAAPVLFWVAGAFLLLAVFAVFFFRDPERRPPALAAVVLAPADGRVTEVGPAGGAEVLPGTLRVSIFLSLFDVHVNRAPVAGRVEAVRYCEGAFRAAFRREAAERNERNELELSAAPGTVRVRQIAGVLARRIVCRARPGDRLRSGERFGLIRFGSRTDALLPPGVEVLVGPGDRVRGGETVIGRWQ